jgi:hypothetical protein
MGLLDFFRGNPIDRFAASFMKEMRRAGCTHELRYERENQRIVVETGETPQQIFVPNFYREFLSLPREERKQHLADRARMFVRKKEDFPEDYETARVNLRPKVWPRAGLESMRLQVLLDDKDSNALDIPEYELGSHLIASVAYDLPDQIASVSNEQLEKWGVTYYEALEIARQNLEQVEFTFAQIGDGCYVSQTGDSYDACRILVPSIVERFTVKGEPIAMIPDRDTLIVCGADDDQALKIMMELAKKSENPRPLVPIPMRLDGDHWADWFPDQSHPHWSGFRELQMQYLHQVYAEQKEMLGRLHEKQGKEAFVATFAVIEKDDGSMYSIASWTKGIESLLPKVDWIAFAIVDEGENGMAALAPWEKVEKVAGHLMKPTDHYPQRFRVTDFPTAEELKELGTATL